MKEVFVYTGGNQVVPENVELVRIEPFVTILEKWAFEDRSKLQYVQFSEGLIEIGSNAFSSCTSLESIRLPSTMRAVRKGAFYNCKGLKYVLPNEGLELIDKDAFSGCGVELVWFPSTMKYVRTGSFENCRALQKVALSEGLVKVENYAFNLCDKLETMEIPSSDTTSIETFAIPEKTVRIAGKDIRFWDEVHSRYQREDKARMEKYCIQSIADVFATRTTTMRDSKPSAQDESRPTEKPRTIIPAPPVTKRVQEAEATIRLKLADKEGQIESLKKLLVSAQKERDELQAKLNEYDIPD
ncbi:MAG: hypothetical protein SGBAC_002934 [Bacillariaceae sp.]